MEIDVRRQGRSFRVVAIQRFLDERARLVREAGDTGSDVASAAIDDLLARSSGDFPARELREVFAAVDLGCRTALKGGTP